jgi:ACS family glucarate transporter-like MFS transporter
MRKRYVVYGLLFSLTAINYIDRMALAIASHQITAEFDISPFMLGLLLSSFLWLYLFALIPMGMLVDRFGTRLVNAWGIGVWSVATLLSAASGGFLSMLVTRLLMGVGESTSYPAGGRVLREWVPARERGMATSLFHAGSLIGPAIAALGLSIIVNSYGWRWAFVLAAAIGFVWLTAWLVWFRQPEKASWLSEEERALILSTRDTATVAQIPDVPRLGLKALLRSKTLWAITFTHGCAVYTTYLFLTWLPSYLQAEKGLTLLKSGLYTAIPYLGAALLGIVIGTLGDRIMAGKSLGDGQRRVVVAACLLMSTLIFFVPFLDDIRLILAVFTLSLTGCTAAVAANLSLINDLIPSKEDSGTAIAVISTGGNFFGICAPIVTGYVISMTNQYQYGFVIAGVLLAVGALVSMFLTRKPIGQAQEVHDVRVAHSTPQ